MSDNDGLVQIDVEKTNIFKPSSSSSPEGFLLQTVDGRFFPIIVNPSDVEMLYIGIMIKQRGKELGRPFTHDLLLRVFAVAGMTIEKAVIRSIEEGAFHAELVLSGPDGSTETIDCRPSDCLTLAVRGTEEFNVYIAEDLLDEVEVDINDFRAPSGSGGGGESHPDDHLAPPLW